MSYIDSYKHELIGLFGGLPVYHPLEDIPGSDNPELTGEFACSTSQIMIGGGGGEWPGLVITSPIGAVIEFLCYGVEEDDFHKKISRADWEEAEDRYRFKGDIFHFCDWRVAHYHEFYDYCRSPAMPRAYDKNGEPGSFEDWLKCSIGEFIFFAMPELAEPFMSKLKDPHEGLEHMSFNNILLVPPNMPVHANGGNAWKMTRRNEP